MVQMPSAEEFAALLMDAHFSPNPFDVVRGREVNLE